LISINLHNKGLLEQIFDLVSGGPAGRQASGIPGTHTIIPQSKLDQKLAKRLINPGKKRDRSVNYLVVEEILEYLEKEENS